MSESCVVREARPGDEERILASFNRAFAAVDPTFRPRTPAEWRWRFRDNPDGARVMLALSEDGEVLAQYAGLGQTLECVGDGRVFPSGRHTLRASQSVDSFVLPDRRAGLARTTLFVRTGLAFAERFGGDAPDRDVLMWGLPVPAALRIGRARLGYRFVRSVHQLVADPARLGSTLPAGVELEQGERFPLEVDALYERLLPGLGLVARRDRQRLDWRYVHHPSERYALAFAHVGGALAGYAVYRSGAFDGAPGGLCCDWLVDPDEPCASAALRAWLAQRAHADRQRRLVAMFGPQDREWRDFQGAGWRVEPTRYTLVARSYRRGLDVDDLPDRLRIALGDTDLV